MKKWPFLLLIVLMSCNHMRKHTEMITDSELLTVDEPNRDKLIDALKKDGLIKADDFSIELKDGKLLINGKEQPAETVKKYDSFFKGQTNFYMKRSSKQKK